MNTRHAFLVAGLLLAGCSGTKQADAGPGGQSVGSSGETSAGAASSGASSAASSGGSLSGTAGSSSGAIGQTASGDTTQGNTASGTGGSVSATTAAGSNSSGTSGGSETSGSAAASGTGGTTTGIPSFVDGGYVFCSIASSPVGGPDHDGGAASWMCPLGTYTCDLTDAPGSCFQCVSDADCTNPALPTYDPSRPRCDLLSGVAGYQNFCQQCATSSDCAGNGNGLYCDLNPAFALPGLVPLGFEACSTLETDCRLDGGTRCDPNADCSADSGACIARPLTCTTDKDCEGLVDSYSLEPFTFCDQGRCSTCEQRDAGTCSCDTDQDCGDAGLICSTLANITPYCAVRCGAAAACPFYASICEADSGTCHGCASDAECLDTDAPQGSICQLGRCGCTADGGCPAGETCELSIFGPFGQCGPPLPSCSPATCPGEFCDWDSGACSPSCGSDYDCSTSFSDVPVCESGTCVQCRSDADCLDIPQAAGGLTPYPLCCLAGDNSYCDAHHYSNFCVPACHNDTDCTFSSGGPTCFVTSDAGHGTCTADRCTSNAECGASTHGAVCLSDAGTTNGYGNCGCDVSSDCPLGEVCDVAGDPVPSCAGCTSDVDCGTGELCDPSGLCRTHCDGTNQCDAQRTLCDNANAQGQNGATREGASAGVIWCYACRTSDDCANGAGCSAAAGGVCTACSSNAECASGACFNGACLTACDDGGSCPGSPGSQVCQPDLGFCYQCLSPIDCPNGEGCNSVTHTCGTCTGPDFYGTAPDDCPPGDVCSLYWLGASPSGTCLQPCDDRSCDVDHPICAKLPALTIEHSFCFGCLSDSDCGDAGTQHCDTSERLTFTCR